MISRLTVLLILSSTVLWSQRPKMDLPLSDTIYKITDKDTLKVHWYTPVKNTDKPTPAVAFFFGGGWRAGKLRAL
jgi:acetyl esterase/lipase